MIHVLGEVRVDSASQSALWWINAGKFPVFIPGKFIITNKTTMAVIFGDLEVLMNATGKSNK